MGLGKNTGNFGDKTFVNISKGKLYTKKTGEEPVLFDYISGKITDMKIKSDTYEGKTYEKVEITLMDIGEKFILSMRIDSGYFRGFINSLKNADLDETLTISPSMKTKDDKTVTTCFVIQNEKPLKHFYTKDNQQDFPQMEMIKINGKNLWDGTKQINFWKEWIESIEWPEGVKEEIINEAASKETTEPVDDLPF